MPESETAQEVGSEATRGPRRRRRIGAGVALVAGSAVVVGVVLGAGPSSSQGAGKPAKSSGAATVARRDLVSTDTESGTLGYANAQTVFNRLSGTITSLPVVGKVIDPGQTLYRVDGAPVVLFDGGTPAYRDLSDGVTNGLDVQELKLNLKARGFDPDHQITVNQTFDAATTAAVDRWQASLGQTQTGTVTLGQIVFLPGPQRITQVDTVLGSTGGASGASGAGAATTTSGAVAAPRAEFVDLTTTAPTTTTTPTTPGTGSGKTTPTCPASVTGQIARNASDSRAISETKRAIAAFCRQRPSSASKTAAQTLAALIALLKAETLQLKRLGAGSSTGTGSGSGKTGSATGTSGGSSGGRTGGGSAAGASSASASSGGGGSASSGGGSSSSGGGSASAGSSSGGGSASSGGTAQAILQTTSTQLVVSVDLDATKQSEAVVGEPVTVELPNGNTVDGKITGVSPVAQSASSSSSASSSGSGGGGGSSSSTPSSTVPVTITLKGHRPETGLDQAAVSVNFQQQVENNVLSVPVTALLATGGGGYAIQESSAPHRLIAVTPGLFAAGFVQVSGAGIYPGLPITDSQG